MKKYVEIVITVTLRQGYKVKTDLERKVTISFLWLFAFRIWENCCNYFFLINYYSIHSLEKNIFYPHVLFLRMARQPPVCPRGATTSPVARKTYRGKEQGKKAFFKKLFSSLCLFFPPPGVPVGFFESSDGGRHFIFLFLLQGGSLVLRDDLPGQGRLDYDRFHSGMSLGNPTLECEGLKKQRDKK